MATSILALGDCHTPLLTVPNWPDPRHSVALRHGREQQSAMIELHGSSVPVLVSYALVSNALVTHLMEFLGMVAILIFSN